MTGSDQAALAQQLNAQAERTKNEKRLEEAEAEIRRRVERMVREKIDELLAERDRQIAEVRERLAELERQHAAAQASTEAAKSRTRKNGE